MKNGKLVLCILSFIGGITFSPLASIASIRAIILQDSLLNHTQHLLFIDSSDAISKARLKQWSPNLHQLLHQNNIPDSTVFWRLTNQLLHAAALNGYPFASFKLDTLKVTSDSIRVIWWFKLNDRFQNGALRLPEPALIRPRVLARALGLDAGKPFSWLSYNDFKNRLSQLSFASLSDTPLVFFENKQAIWQIPIKAEKSTQAEGILGFQSGESSVRLTGELLLDFKNSFRHADQVRLHYRSFPGGSQQFELLTILPFWGGSPWGGQIAVNMFRRDSTFLELEPELRALYKTGVYSEFQLFYRSRQTFPIQPSLAGFSTLGFQSWGFSLGYQRFDDPLLPIKGVKFKLEVSAGNRKQDEVSKPAYRYRLDFAWHVPLYQRLTNSLSVLLQGLESAQLLPADWFRTGGVNSLRGFDEASLLASRWLLISTEPHFFLDRNSYLLASIQWAQGLKQSEVFQASAIGLGLGLKVKAGQFQVVYALGALSPNPLQLNLAKVHLGYRLVF